VLCTLCGKHEADERYREVIGWEKVRRGEGGGLHALVKPKPTGRVACVGCLLDIRNGFAPGTPKLFE
jgi:hypothetical protein